MAIKTIRNSLELYLRGLIKTSKHKKQIKSYPYIGKFCETIIFRKDVLNRNATKTLLLQLRQT